MKWNKEYTKEYNRQYYLKNTEHIAEYQNQYYFKNIKHIRERQKKYNDHRYLKNRKRAKKFRFKNPGYLREWYLKNKEYIKEYNSKNREHRREYERNKKKTEPDFRLACNMRTAMGCALQGRKKSARTMKIIGCTVEELWIHLESCPSWEPWMTRENYGKNGWDVDHIIPVSQWNFRCPLQFALCWDKSNLQPMEHIANIKKGNRYEMEQVI